MKDEMRMEALKSAFLFILKQLLENYELMDQVYLFDKDVLSGFLLCSE